MESDNGTWAGAGSIDPTRSKLGDDLGGEGSSEVTRRGAISCAIHAGVVGGPEQQDASVCLRVERIADDLGRCSPPTFVHGIKYSLRGSEEDH